MRIPLSRRPDWHTARRVLPLIVTALVVSACGGGGGGGGSGSGSGFAGEDTATDTVTSYFLERVLAVESCTRMSGSENVRVEFAETRACPTSGWRCCLA